MKQFHNVIEKYIKSVSYSLNYYCDKDDVRQEMMIKLYEIESQILSAKKPFGLVATALSQVRQTLIIKYQQELHRREIYNNDVFVKSKTMPSISNINLFFTIDRIKKDINDHCLSKDRMGRVWRLHQAEEYHYILNSLLAGVEKESIRIYMQMNAVTFKKRLGFIRKLFKKYYEPDLKKVFAHLDDKTLQKIRQSLKTQSIKKVARQFGVAPSAVACYVTQVNKNGFSRNWNDRGAKPFIEEIKVLIKKTPGRNYADIAAKIKARMEDLYKYKDNYKRYYSLVIKHKSWCQLKK